MVDQFSMGNLGGSSVSCNSYQMRDQEIKVGCETGLIQWQHAKFGVMTSQIKEKIFCREEAIWKEDHHKGFVNCTALVDFDRVNTYLSQQCDQQKTCNVVLPYVYREDPPDKSWLQPDGQCGRGAFFYVQVPCTIPQDQAVDRKLFGLLTGCITILIYLFVVVYFDYLKSK
jgi:hypothetical protein